MKKKNLIGLAVVLYLLVGVTGFFRLPAIFMLERTVTTYVDGDSDLQVARSKTRCRGLPLVLVSCRTTIEAPGETRPST